MGLIPETLNNQPFSNEPRKKNGLTFHESSWLINRDPYFMVYEKNTHITGYRCSSPIYRKQPGFFFIAQMDLSVG